MVNDFKILYNLNILHNMTRILYNLVKFLYYINILENLITILDNLIKKSLTIWSKLCPVLLTHEGKISTSTPIACVPLVSRPWISGGTKPAYSTVRQALPFTNPGVSNTPDGVSNTVRRTKPKMPWYKLSVLCPQARGKEFDEHSDRVRAARANSQPSTLHPKPYTLNPQPYTLNPTPYTLPYTLHSKP